MQKLLVRERKDKGRYSYPMFVVVQQNDTMERIEKKDKNGWYHEFIFRDWELFVALMLTLIVGIIAGKLT